MQQGESFVFISATHEFRKYQTTDFLSKRDLSVCKIIEANDICYHQRITTYCLRQSDRVIGVTAELRKDTFSFFRVLHFKVSVIIFINCD